MALSQPLGRRAMSRSLDNTLRVVHLEPTEWVLCDIRIQALVDGYGQGVAYLWSEGGTLLATASQSMSVRLLGPAGGSVAARDGQSRGRPMKISTMLSYAGGFRKAAAEVAELEKAGLDLVWVAEAYGLDGPSLMGYLAALTERVEIGSAILPIFTRTPP